MEETKPVVKENAELVEQKIRKKEVSTAQKVANAVWNEVKADFVPAFKKGVYDTIINCFSMAFYGSPKAPGSRNPNDPVNMDKPSYTRYYREGQINQSSSNINRRPSTDYKNFEMSNRQAYSIIEELKDIIRRDGCVSIAEYMDILQEEIRKNTLPGEPIENLDYDYTYRYYGWYDLSACRVIPSGNQFSIMFPQTVSINKR